MTRLLVSVRSLDEARLAAAAGVDLIDLKEPRRGSLGRVELNVAREISDVLAPAHALSMALGELAEWTPGDWQVCRQLPSGIVYAKVGLAGCAGLANWWSVWQRAMRSFPPHCQPVAVVYADWPSAAAPGPDDVLAAAAESGCRTLLIDTWQKAGGDVFAHLRAVELRDLLCRAGRDGMLTVLAGSLSLANVDAAIAVQPDYLAVRGAICDGPRESELCPAKLRQWQAFVRSGRSASAAVYAINPCQRSELG